MRETGGGYQDGESDGVGHSCDARPGEGAVLCGMYVVRCRASMPGCVNLVRSMIAWCACA